MMRVLSSRTSWSLVVTLVVTLLISSLNVEAEQTPIASSDSAAAGDAFEGCARAGGRIQEIYPPRCVSKDGSIHTRTSAAAKSCKDLCGDRQCQEIVCQAVGCPCAESPKSCPTDCKE
jgi:hypothetical protein